MGVWGDSTFAVCTDDEDHEFLSMSDGERYCLWCGVKDGAKVRRRAKDKMRRPSHVHNKDEDG